MYTEIINKNLINYFLLNCKTEGLNKKTINNYKADLNLFLKFVNTLFAPGTQITNEIIESFINYQKSNKKSISTINRSLSTLRNYFSYINSIGIKTNENLSEIKNKKNIYKNFVNYLNSQKLSKVTKTNYKSDVANFFEWAKNKNINEENLEKYQIDYYLFDITNKYSESSVNRKKSSFEFFWNWYANNKASYFNLNTNKSSKEKYYENLVYFSFLAGFAIVVVTYSAINSISNSSNWSKYINPNIEAKNVIYASDNQNYKFTLKDSLETNDNKKNNIPMLISQNENTLPYQQAGKATINKNENFIIISSNKIKKESVIIVTPITNMEDNNFYISSQEEGFAIISLDKEAQKNISFNYLII